MLPKEINEYELQQVAAVLAVINPGKAEIEHIRNCINANWPFDNIATGGWVAYHENPKNPDNETVRVALTPYSVTKYLQAMGKL